MINSRRVPLTVVILTAAWLGAGLLVAAVVAPAAFAVLPTRTLAGAVVGRVLAVLFVSGMAIGLLLGWRGRTIGRALGALTFVACAVAQFVIDPQIAAIRAAVGGPIEALALADPRRIDFGRLHGFSVLALGVAMAAAAVALLLGSIDRRTEERS